MTFCCYSLGCKANQAENDSIAELLVSRGHTRAVWSEAVTPGREAPGAVIINTCAVTGEASRKTRGAIRRARRMFPDAVLAVYGCFAEGGEGTHPMELADVTGGTAGRAAFALRVEAKWIEKSAGKPAGKPAAMPRA
ncbi:MAG: hypothetical protein FWH06_07920, partial [Oscillospiraceae bacterium]|nr:hypothetical protein [Oscillospiraceae bacterium]